MGRTKERRRSASEEAAEKQMVRDAVQKQFLLLVGQMNNALPNISDLAKKYHAARPGLGDGYEQQMQEIALPGVLNVLRKTKILRQMFSEGTKKFDSDDLALVGSMDDLIAELSRLVPDMRRMDKGLITST